MTLESLNNWTDWTIIEDTFDDCIYNVDSIREMYTMLEYKKDVRVKALITYSVPANYPIREKWVTLYFFNADGKCYNTINGFLGYID